MNKVSNSKPVSKKEDEDFVFDIFKEYADGSFDIMFLKELKSLLFLGDYEYTLDLLKVKTSDFDLYYNEKTL